MTTNLSSTMQTWIICLSFRKAGVFPASIVTRRCYIRSCIREHREYSGRFPTENELVEIRKRAISVLEDEWHITLRNDKQWRQFFQDNAKAAIAKLQKETEGNE